MNNKKFTDAFMAVLLVVMLAVFCYLFDRIHSREPDILSRDRCVGGYLHSYSYGGLRQIMDSQGKGIKC